MRPGIEATVNYLVPTLGYPLQATLEDGPVEFLKAHLGLERVFTFGPISPNYGSYSGVAELDDAELPIPKAWDDYFHARLDTRAAQGSLGGADADEFAKHVVSLEGAAVAYLVASPGVRPFANSRK
jgi:hypothetical protein